MKLRPDTLAMTAVLAMLTALGPLSTDFYLPSLPEIARVMQTDVAEAFEPAGEGRGGSSTMPHKRNPVAAASALGAAVNLAERGCRRWLEIKLAEALAPAGAEFRHHPPLDEGRAHRRRLRLQLLQFGGVFRRHDIGDGGDELRHLHDRTLETAERRGELGGILGAVEIETEDAGAGDPRRDPSDIGADPGVARRAG